MKRRWVKTLPFTRFLIHPHGQEGFVFISLLLVDSLRRVFFFLSLSIFHSGQVVRVRHLEDEYNRVYHV